MNSSVVERQEQLYLHDPANGVIGDCYRTAIAMCLGVPAASVPHFAEMHELSGKDWREATLEWLGQFGLGMIEIPFPGECGLDAIAEQLDRGVGSFPATIGGKSPRNEGGHEVVAFEGRIIDPHPDQTGLDGPMRDGHFWVRIICATPLTIALAARQAALADD